MTVNTINNLSNTDTFGTWKDRTNAIATVIRTQAVTMSDTVDTNTGNINLTGNLIVKGGSTHHISVETIKGPSNVLTISETGDTTKIMGNVEVSNGDAVAEIQLRTSSLDTWKLHTDSTHSYLRITGNVSGSYLQLNDTTVTSNNLKIDDNILPTTITKKITHDGTSGGASTFNNVAISGGSIDGTPIGATSRSTGEFTKLVCSGAQAGTIDNVAIGASTAAAGTFTTLSATTSLAVAGNITMTGTGLVDGVDVADLNSKLSDAENQLADARVTAILQAVYPVGSIYMSASNGTNPATIFGFGTWKRYGEGRTMISVMDKLNINSLGQLYNSSGGASSIGFVNDHITAALSVGITGGASKIADSGINVGDSVNIFGVTGQGTASTLNLAGTFEVVKIASGNIIVKLPFEVTTTQANESLSFSSAKLWSTDYIVSGNKGGKANHTLTRQQMQHQHTTGTFAGTGNDDFYPIQADRNNGNNIANDAGGLSQYGIPIDMFPTTYDSYTVTSRWIAGEGNRTNYSNRTSGTNGTMTAVTAPLYDDDMVQASSFGTISPYITTHMWYRES